MTDDQLKELRAVQHDLAAVEDTARLFALGLENLCSDQQVAWGPSACEVIADRLGVLWKRVEAIGSC